MQSGFTALGKALDGKDGAKAILMKSNNLLLQLHTSSLQYAPLKTKSENLELALVTAMKIRATESKAANALHANAVSVLLKLEKALDNLQPSIGTFQVSANAIVAQVRAAGTAALPPADKSAPSVKPPPEEQQPSLIPGNEIANTVLNNAKNEVDAKLLSDLIDAHLANIAQAFTLLGNAAVITDEATDICKGKLTAVIPTLTVSTSEPIVLAVGEDRTVVTSGGTGIHTGIFVNEMPPNDLLIVIPSFRPNGTAFMFKQLKASEKTADKTYTYLVVDSATTPQTTEIKVTILKKVVPEVANLPTPNAANNKSQNKSTKK
jgi:hypothetical protein